MKKALKIGMVLLMIAACVFCSACNEEYGLGDNEGPNEEYIIKSPEELAQEYAQACIDQDKDKVAKFWPHYYEEAKAYCDECLQRYNTTADEILSEFGGYEKYYHSKMIPPMMEWATDVKRTTDIIHPTQIMEEKIEKYHKQIEGYKGSLFETAMQWLGLSEEEAEQFQDYTWVDVHLLYKDGKIGTISLCFIELGGIWRLQDYSTNGRKGDLVLIPSCLDSDVESELEERGLWQRSSFQGDS